MSTDEGTEQRILKCVDEVLSTLGDSASQAIHYYLEMNVGLKKEEIPQKPELFCEGLNLIFGQQGANFVGSSIVRKLMANFGLKHKSTLTLTKAIALVKAEHGTARGSDK
jgi:hypothetical protein